MKIFIFLFLLITYLCASWKSEREALKYHYIVGNFRIFYDTEGKNALPLKNQADNNHNFIPDYVENIALRLELSKKLYTEVLNFQNPLQSQRYKDIKYIDVHILKTDSSSSGDGVNLYNYKTLPNKDKAIAIKLSNDLREDTLTPSHEYFHTIQNSYTMFKNRWYTEGTARWSEGIFKEGTGKRDPLPQNSAELKDLLKKTYDAQFFWRRLTYLCDKDEGHFQEDSWMQQSTSGYPKLIKDNRVYGYSFMKAFLQNLDKEDNEASKQRGVEEFEWKEKDQRENQDNNKYILKALHNTIATECKIKNDELTNFTNTIDLYIKEQSKPNFFYNYFKGNR